MTSYTSPQVVIFNNVIIAHKLLTQKRPDFLNGSIYIDFHIGAIPKVPIEFFTHNTIGIYSNSLHDSTTVLSQIIKEYNDHRIYFLL